jgi:hypothetical protein
MLFYSIKAQKNCNEDVKMFATCRKTLQGKFVLPKMCQEEAIKVIDCL